MPTTRTFVAVEVPGSLSEKLARLQSELAREVGGVRWSAVRPFHVTLAFLGDVADTDLNDVCRAVEAAAGRFPPLELQAEGLGAFGGPKRPRTLWVGVSGHDRPVLDELQSALCTALGSTGYGCDSGPFQSHVTLGRVVRSRNGPPDLTRLLEAHKSWSAGTFRVSEVVTFGSTLTPEGPIYTALGRARLAGGKRASRT